MVISFFRFRGYIFLVFEYNTYVQINKDVQIYSLKQIEWKKKSKSEVGLLSDSTENGESLLEKYALEKLS